MTRRTEWLLVSLLLTYTVVILLVPSARIAVPSLPVRVALEVVIVMSVAGAALLLSLLDRSSSVRGADAFVAALVVQAVTGVGFALLPAMTGAAPTLQQSFYPWIVGRYVAGALMLVAAVQIRPASIPLVVGIALLVLAVVDILIARVDPSLPFAVRDPGVLSTELSSYLIEAGPMLMFAVGAAVALHRATPSTQPLEWWLGVSLMVGVATQIHEAMFPAALGAVITSADVFRLLAALSLSAGVIAQVIGLQHQRDRAMSLLTSDLQRNEESLAEVRRAREREAAFMSVVAHELTSPLAAINARGHVLNHLADDRQRPHVSAVMAEAARLSALVERMDELRSIEDVGFAIECRPVAIRPLLDEIAVFVGGLPGRHVALVDAEPLRVQADPTRLGQVLRNLAANAVRYSPAAAPIRITGWATGAERYRIELADEGPGVQRDDLEALFSPYVRGHAATAVAADAAGAAAEASDDGGGLAAGDPAPADGFGLGLHLARRLVQAQGGTIFFDRPAEPGTRVVVELAVA